MTTSDRSTDPDPTLTSSAYREQPDTDTGQQVGSPAEPGTSTATLTDDTATDGTADTRASGMSAVPRGGSDESEDGTAEPLLSQQRSAEYNARWDQVKGGFVDEPRQAIAAADQLVSELLGELQELFGRQRHDIEHGLDNDETSTEDLRLGLRRYRTFFDRLLSI